MKSGISPRRALAYRPLRSRRSHSSSGVATCTRKNAPPASSVRLPHVLPGRVERRDRAAHGHPSVAGDLGGDPADPPDVGLAVRAAEGEAGRQVSSYDVAVEAGDRALAVLEQAVHHRLGDGRLPAAGQAGESSTSPCASGAGWSGC